MYISVNLNNAHTQFLNDCSMNDDGDVCPICKSSRYLNPDMRFLVNPECYHKMCESCVDRIFAVGPAPCPYRGCGKILRKNKFKSQLFEDLGVEKEVDVRQRVLKTLNKHESDFGSLDEYNNYLEQVETTVFNLVHGVDVEATLEQLQSYEKQNRAKILEISLRQQNEEAAADQWATLEKQRKAKERALRKQFELDEKEIRANAEQELLRELTMAGPDQDPHQITKQVHKRAASKLHAKQAQLDAEIAALHTKATPITRFRGRTDASSAESSTPPTPFTPFNGDRQTEYAFHEETRYFDPTVDDATSRPDCLASGFSVQRARHQSLVQAFWGLGCDIGKEKKMLAV